MDIPENITHYFDTDECVIAQGHKPGIGWHYIPGELRPTWANLHSLMADGYTNFGIASVSNPNRIADFGEREIIAEAMRPALSPAR